MHHAIDVGDGTSADSSPPRPHGVVRASEVHRGGPLRLARSTPSVKRGDARREPRRRVELAPGYVTTASALGLDPVGGRTGNVQPGGALTCAAAVPRTPRRRLVGGG